MSAISITKLLVVCVIVSIAQAASTAIKIKLPVESNRLLLRDCPYYPPINNAVDHIRSLIVNKLNLPHLEWQILLATYTDKGLLFEMSSHDEVEEILEQFAVKLRNKNCVLQPTHKTFFDTIQQ